MKWNFLGIKKCKKRKMKATKVSLLNIKLVYFRLNQFIKGRDE